MTRDSRRSLPPDVAARIARLEIHAREIVEGFLNGLHRSPYFGQSVEFVQHRDYVPGDDARRIDWKLWSKTDKYYLKLYEEETNLRAVLVVDVSESMLFGTDVKADGAPTKLDQACTLAAALGYLLLKQNDSVGLVAFDNEIRVRTPMRSQPTHLQTIARELSTVAPARKTSLLEILKRVADDHPRRSLIVLMSDLFVSPDDLKKGLGLLRARGHDVLILHTLHQRELDFKFSGTTRFIGLEETGELICDPKGLREGYLAALQSFLDSVRRICLQQRADYRLVVTNERVDAVLADILSRRAEAHLRGQTH